MNRYRDYNTYLKDLFGERVQKISLDAGLGCPNRDGTISEEGCIFCDSRGSGTGAFIWQGLSIEEQIERGQRVLKRRYKARKFIAYFQSFSNTHAPIPQLKALYDRALACEDMVGLSVATRPDCVNREVMGLLGSYQNDYLVWLELGLQSAHDRTLRRINRGHDVAAFRKAVQLAEDARIPVCAHVIMGLPGEDREMMMETAQFLAKLPVRGVKIHLLYVVEGTRLADLYREGEFNCLEQEQYVNLVVDFLERLPPSVVVQRLTGDPVPTELMAPTWALEKSETLNLIRRRMERRDTWQGRRYLKSSAANGP